MGQAGRAVLVAAGFLSAAGSLGAQGFTQGFDDVAALPSAGWVQINRSQPLGESGWFQGATTVFPSQGGAPNSYIGANFDNTAGGGTISNWLLTPTFTLATGGTLSFYTRTTGSQYPDRLEVRMSTQGSSTDVGGSASSVGAFTTLLLSINPNLAQGGYPAAWTQQTVTVPSLPAPVQGRLAFRYFVTDSGPNGLNGDYIGIDTVVATVPAPVTLSVGDVSVAEGNAGITNAVFTVSLSAASTQAVTVGYATANGTAIAPGDYGAVSGSLAFSAGTVTRQVSVPVAGDQVTELDETFTLNLSAPTGATIHDGQGVGTIVNDDIPSLSIGDVTVAEGDGGPLNAVFTVSLSPAALGPVSVSYGTADGTASGGLDFGTVAGALAFPVGTTTRTLLVPVLGDRIQEPAETFRVLLSGASGAAVADGEGQGTITDNDAAGLSISDVTVRERLAPDTAVARFTVRLSPASQGGVFVNWATADGTATAADGDYEAGGGQILFPPGEDALPVEVAVNGDGLVEGVETFAVTLSNAIGAPIASGTGTARVLDPPAGGDFDGDGSSDLVWRHGVSGENVLWYMDGADLIAGTLTTPPSLPDTRWKIVGTSDFNGDTQPDILWRHAASGENVVWYMDGSVLQSGTFLTPSSLADVRWGMSGTGDFNLDGRPDILWRHSQSGELVAWLMNGSVLQSGTFLTPPSFDLLWQAAGTGDFNSDGTVDILWRHATSGQIVVWFLDGTSLVSGAFTDPPALADPGWRIVATEDYDRDGKVDIVWRHVVSGQNVIWFMDGTSLVSGSFTDPSLPDADWQIVGPR